MGAVTTEILDPVAPAQAAGRDLKTLIWHWGRRGAGPVFAARLAAAFADLPGSTAALSLAAGAEILAAPDAPPCDWREPTYRTRLGYAGQWLKRPVAGRQVLRQLDGIRPGMAICAMPALLDQRMVGALRRRKIPYAVVVHDAAGHPGEALNFWLLGQNRLLRHAAALFPLSAHVEAALRGQKFDVPIAKLWHPPFIFGPAPPPPLRHGGRPRLLNFGRLLPYKGLDLLADALAAFGADLPFDVRICGDGPKSAELDRLRAMPNVSVEHRWIPEAELSGLIAWADAVVLPYREASQSGVAAAAVAQGRYVLATNVGGLPEQLAGVAGAVLCEPEAGAIAAGLKRLFDGPPSPPPADAAADWRQLAAQMLATAREVVETG
jgi:glycosyltransferase involved in cell wall biosynthesis